MMIVRFRAILADGDVIIGSIQGSGGRIGSGAAYNGPEAARREAEERLAAFQRCAAEGRQIPGYEPKPGHVAMYPEEGGPPRIVPLLGTHFEIEEEA